MTDVVKKLWGYCKTLRHDGIGYGDYIEQLTYILFLKLANEKGVQIPREYDWTSLTKLSGTDLLDHYTEVLRKLGKQEGLLGAIFAGSISKFREPVNLKRLITMIDEEEWSTLDIDLKAEAYEGLLQKYAEDEKGAGQYFTPRPVIRTIVKLVKPDIRASKGFTVHDPAVGTAGFLIGAYEWLLSQTKEGATLSVEERERLQKHTFSGGEIVLETRRLALMNLYLHEIEALVYYGDSLAEGPHVNQRYDCVMTNPPFGETGAGTNPNRGDFTVETANKQLNFVQHLMSILKPGGRAAIVIPDSVLFEVEGGGRSVRELLLHDCDLHTILRLPYGTFNPYSPAMANVMFFRKGTPTEGVWVYDLRTNISKITKKKNPLKEELFSEFVSAYGDDPNGHPRGGRQELERFKYFSRKQIEARNYDLDLFWLRDEATIDFKRIPNPQGVIEECSKTYSDSVRALDAIKSILNKSKFTDMPLRVKENPWELPKGWSWTTLGEVADVIMGQSPPGSSYNRKGAGLPFLQGTADFGELYPEAVIWCSAPKKKAAKGDILMSVRAPVGSTNIAQEEYCIGRGLCAIRASKGMRQDYLFSYLRFVQPNLSVSGKGTTFKAMKKDHVKAIQIPLPPEGEQDLIAEILKAATANMNILDINSKNALSNLSALRQAIMFSAFRGCLSNRKKNPN